MGLKSEYRRNGLEISGPGQICMLEKLGHCNNLPGCSEQDMRSQMFKLNNVFQYMAGKWEAIFFPRVILNTFSSFFSHLWWLGFLVVVFGGWSLWLPGFEAGGFS